MLKKVGKALDVAGSIVAPESNLYDIKENIKEANLLLKEQIESQKKQIQLLEKILLKEQIELQKKQIQLLEKILSKEQIELQKDQIQLLEKILLKEEKKQAVSHNYSDSFSNDDKFSNFLDDDELSF